MPTLYLGARYVLLPQSDADAAIAAIERERITHVMLVPTQIIAILSSRQYRPERLASRRELRAPYWAGREKSI